MTPVEAISTCSLGHLTTAEAASMVCRATMSMSGVAQLALPALQTMARAKPPLFFKFRLERSTGAARTWFCVKTPAAEAGWSETISAKSGFCFLRMPA